MKSTAFFPDVPEEAKGKEIVLPCRQEDGSLVPLELPLLVKQEYTMGGTYRAVLYSEGLWRLS